MQSMFYSPIISAMYYRCSSSFIGSELASKMLFIFWNASSPNLFFRKSARRMFRFGDVGVFGLNSSFANEGFFCVISSCSVFSSN